MIPFMIFSIVRYSYDYIITIWSSDDYIIEIEKIMILFFKWNHLTNSKEIGFLRKIICLKFIH